MADFKLCIADTKNGKTYPKEVKDKEAASFIGKNIGETIKGEIFGLTGYEFKITGGSDNCGFPMRGGILGARKKLNLAGGVGIRENLPHGIKRKKTVCGHKISASIVQINIKPVKDGQKPLAEIFAKTEESKAEKK